MSFGADLKRFEAKTTEKMDRAIRKITLDVFESVILMSPVGNMDLWENPPRGKYDDVPFPSAEGYLGGRFRGNWQPAIGVQPSGTVETVDPSGNIVMAKVAGVTGRVEVGDVIYMVNNLPYAQPLEDGHSQQAPAGMVRLTVQRFIPIVDAVISQVART